MVNLLKLWNETREFVHSHEMEIAGKYIHFLREAALHYISEGKRVYFRENTVVHYGEGGFGSLLVESDDDESKIFGSHVTEIRFESKPTERDVRGYTQINEQNIEKIRYKVD